MDRPPKKVTCPVTHVTKVTCPKFLISQQYAEVCVVGEIFNTERQKKVHACGTCTAKIYMLTAQSQSKLTCPGHSGSVMFLPWSIAWIFAPTNIVVAVSALNSFVSLIQVTAPFLNITMDDMTFVQVY